MQRYMRALAIVLFSLLAWSVHAQITNPVTVGWTPPLGAIVGYRITMDGVQTDVGLPANDPRCTCPAFSFTLLGGNHTATVSAYNAAGESPQSSPLTFSVTAGLVPNAPTNLVILPNVPAPPPTTWLSTNVGNTQPPGTSSVLNGVWTLRSAGLDTWGPSDSFHYVYRAMTGDGQIEVKVESLTNTAPNAKAGLMWRESIDANARHVVFAAAPNGFLEFMARSATGGNTSYIAGVNAQFPVWLRLVRAGSTVVGYYSQDGTTWVGVSSSPVSFAPTVTYGLITLSHASGVTATGTFSGLKP